MKNFKNKKGITLVALIITIIVLLILAVVAISAVTGDGIIAHAKNARDDYQTAQEVENTVLENYLVELNNANGELNKEQTSKVGATFSGYYTEYDEGEPVEGSFVSEEKTLTWEELRDPANGSKYGYDSAELTDEIIGEWIFAENKNLISITIPNTVTSIGESAFQGCKSLTGIIISNSVTSIGNWAFAGCNNLENIIVDSSNTKYSSIDGILFNNSKSILINYPIGKTNTTYEVPNSVTSIGDNAFEGYKSLTGVTIPNSVTSIGTKAFNKCTNLSITVGSESVKTLVLGSEVGYSGTVTVDSSIN